MITSIDIYALNCTYILFLPLLYCSTYTGSFGLNIVFGSEATLKLEISVHNGLSGGKFPYPAAIQDRGLIRFFCDDQ